MINTSPVTFRSGTVYFAIGATNTGLVELSDMSELAYEFDLKQAQSAINAIAIIPGSMTISVWDKTSKGVSLYDILSAEIGTYTVSPPSTDVKMYYTPHGQSTANTFPFQLQFSGVKTDYKNGITQLALLPPLQDNESYASRYKNLGNTIPGFDYDQTQFRVNVKAIEGVTITNYDGFRAGFFIEDFVNRIDDEATANVFVSGYNSITMTPTNFPVPGYNMNATAYVFTNIYTGNGSTLLNLSLSDVPVKAKVFSAGIMEGAILGSAFGVNFYVNRMSNTINKSISNSDILDLSFVKNERQVNGINVYISTTNIATLPISTQIMFPAGSFEAGYFTGAQFIGLELLAHGPHMGRGIDIGDPDNTRNIIDTTSSAASMNTNVRGLAQAGAVAYAHAFGSYQGKSIEKVETTIAGVGRVLPHEVIRFDSTTPGATQNKHFRPSSLKYDFKDDTIKITAYQIP